MDNFNIQRKSMVENSKQTKLNVPKLVKNTTLAEWNYSIKAHAYQGSGARKATLEYFLRTNDEVVAPHPHLMMDHHYSTVAGSMQGEQNLRLSLNHPLYRDGNKSFFAILEVDLRSTTYKSSIKPFQSTGNGCGAYKDLIA